MLDGRLADVGGEDLNRDAARLVAEEFEQHDRDRVGFLARGAARHPDADRLLAVAHLHDAREDLLHQRGERVGLAEEARHVDQDVLVERDDLGLVLFEERDVVLELRDLVEDHPSLDPPHDRRHLVALEIDVRRGAEQREDPLERRVRHGLGRGGVVASGGGATERYDRQRLVGVPGDADQLGRDLLRREDEVDEAARDRGARHALVFRGFGTLRDGQAADALDVANARRAVRRRARHDHGDRAVLGGVGERAEEAVDRRVLRAVGRTLHERDVSVLDRHRHVRRHDVDVVGLDAHPVLGLEDRQRRLRRQ